MVDIHGLVLDKTIQVLDKMDKVMRLNEKNLTAVNINKQLVTIRRAKKDLDAIETVLKTVRQ